MSYDTGKYKVVKSIPRDGEVLPAAFLADSVEEAERVYCEFSPLLNSVSYAYHKNTNLDKADLFGEGLVGLARAVRDFDPARGDFRSYAIYRIKDAMNKLVRELNSPVKIPSYIKKSNAIICELKNYLTDEGTCVSILDIQRNADTEKYFVKLEGYAKRSDLCLKDLLTRAEYLPDYLDYENDNSALEDIDFNSILISELKEQMTEKELIVVEGFLAGKNFSAISADMGMSESWAKNTFDRMCDRLKNL